MAIHKTDGTIYTPCGLEVANENNDITNNTELVTCPVCLEVIRKRRLDQLVERKTKAYNIVKASLPDVPKVALDRIFDLLLTDEVAEMAFDKYLRTVRAIDREFA